MRISKIFKDLLYNPDRSYEERNLLMLEILSEVAMIIAVLFDISYGENKVEIIFLIGMILASPIITWISVKKNRAQIGSLIQIILLVFLLLPILFFYGGGPMGGGIFWIIYAYMFIGMSTSGVRRNLLIICHTFISLGEYTIWMLRPESVYPHTIEVFYMDAIVSLILVGLSTYGMLRYQKTIYREENRRAVEEARRAEELNRAQSQFFSSMSHEIRTPINSILGLNEIILRQEDASDEIRKDAVNIQGAGKMLLSLVNDILDLSKIEAGKMDIVPVNYELGRLISDIVNMIWHRADQKGLKLKVDVDPSLPSEYFGDEVRIKQVLINILNNAVKYTREGSITLHIERDMTEEGETCILFSVTDTGVGIKTDALPYLFEVFKRVDEANNRYIEGTGLGLSIVKQLVDLMGGTVTVNSVYMQGATFTVSIPQIVINETPIGDINLMSIGSENNSIHYKSSFTAKEARILIVDDNEMNLEVAKKLIEPTKVEVDTVTSGADAVNMTQKRQYDVILMDHLMPEMDGIECMSRIRSQVGGLNTETPVIVLTANVGSDNQDMYMKSGFDGYLVKPVSGALLEETLLNHIPWFKIVRGSKTESAGEQMNTAKGYRRKVPV
ncbi:MAG: response regulator, partial [Lachnospiraceae bacterium]|nr:response regulator [Lachnospiraceae bacterium]